VPRLTSSDLPQNVSRACQRFSRLPRKPPASSSQQPTPSPRRSTVYSYSTTLTTILLAFCISASISSCYPLVSQDLPFHHKHYRYLLDQLPSLFIIRSTTVNADCLLSPSTPPFSCPRGCLPDLFHDALTVGAWTIDIQLVNGHGSAQTEKEEERE
jgi:hypothetical protein